MAEARAPQRGAVPVVGACPWTSWSGPWSRVASRSTTACGTSPRRGTASNSLQPPVGVP